MKVTHAVDDEGRVYCAKRLERIDVLACYGCDRLVDIDVDTRRPRVTCELDRPEDRRPADR